MCTCRQSDDTSSAVSMVETTGLKGGASCSHRSKKALFKTKELRKKLKSPKRSCEECERMVEKNQATPENLTDEILLCISCGRLACEDHVKKHVEAVRNGDPHYFLLSINKGILRCHPCDVDLEPLDDPQDPVKSFYNEFKSFNKTKADAEEKKKEDEKVRSEEKEKSVSILTPTPSSQPTKQPERTFKNKQDGERKSQENAGNNAALEIEKLDTMIPAKGQANLGNTCFFNSVMQCLMHTHHLDYYFKRFGRVEKLIYSEPKTVVLCEEKIELPVAEMPVPFDDCPLNDVLKCHLTEFRIGHSPEPRTVFSEVSRKAPRFKGWAQQDAHELLRYLLDGLRSEEQERYKSAIAKHYGVSKEKRTKSTDPVIVKNAKAYLQAAGRPLLDSVFGGTLLQTIHCRECGHVSQAMEQFLDLSVPITTTVLSSARKPAGQISTHKKKKEAKLTKKMAKRAAKKSPIASTETTGDETVSSEKSTVTKSQKSDNSESAEEEELTDEDDFEEERMAEGQSDMADKLDLTKVLAAAPEEYQQSKNSIGTCLLAFTAQELLKGANSYECEGCCLPENKKTKAKGEAKRRVEADKRYLIYEPPVVLTLQLKRFQQIHSSGRLSTSKLSGHIEFPLIFDIAPFCCKSVQRVAAGQKSIFYSLYGVVVHSGGLSGGHYIAYVKSRHRVPRAFEFLEAARSSCVDAMASAPVISCEPISESNNTDGQWYYCSDSHVKPVAEKDVLNSEAYILFYERSS